MAELRQTAGRTIVLIPARMASTRLPGKPLADIHGSPMIVHCLRRAEAAGVGPVAVACAEAEIRDAVEAAGGRAVLTRPDHPTGSDRICEALGLLDPARDFDTVVNLQGDLPSLEPRLLAEVLRPLSEPAVDIASLVVEIGEEETEVRRNPNVPKVACDFAPGSDIARAAYFSRAPVPWTGDQDRLPLYYHIGLYALRRDALERFVALPPSPLEQRERLEQLRAIEAGMRIDVVRVDTIPHGVDTPADLALARDMLAPGSAG